MRTILQIPVDSQLRNRATKAAEQQGFSSLQEAIRVFLSEIAAENLRVMYAPPAAPLSVKNEKRYARMIRSIATGVEKVERYPDSAALIRSLSK